VHVVGPAQFIEQIRTNQTLSIHEIDVETIRHDFTLEIQSRLVDQLSASNIEQPEKAAELMLFQASDFLQNDAQLIMALNRQLALLSKREADWQLASSNNDLQVFRTDDQCLTITRVEGSWRLKRLTACSELPARIE
jgi:hypothetical protein